MTNKELANEILNMMTAPKNSFAEGNNIACYLILKKMGFVAEFNETTGKWEIR